MPKVLAVRELRTHAMGLPHLRYLVAETVEGLAMGRHGAVPVRIPHPERLALHKMLVSQLRAATSDKRMKDIEQAAVLVAILTEQAPTALAEAFAAVPRSAIEKTRRGAAQARRGAGDGETPRRGSRASGYGPRECCSLILGIDNNFARAWIWNPHRRSLGPRTEERRKCCEIDAHEILHEAVVGPSELLAKNHLRRRHGEDPFELDVARP